MSRAIITTHSQEDRVAVRFPYQPDVNVRLKDHGGRWDPDLRAWHIPRSSLLVVSRILETEFGMDIINDTGFSDPERRRPESVVIDRVHFYKAMFARLPNEDRRAKYRDLMRAFHPDTFGDPDEATAINIAYDHVQARNRKGA